MNIQKMRLDYPKIIEVQFHNLCNSNCLMCPYASMGYKAEKMDQGLFDKFVKDLNPKKLKRIIPYLNNEPFIDSGYIEKLQKIRKKCPNTEIEISTNAYRLNEDILKQLLLLNITELRLSVFAYSASLYKKMMPGLNKKIVFNNLKTISRVFKNSITIISIVMIDTGEIKETEFCKIKTLSEKLGFKFERWGFLDRAKNVKVKSNNFYEENTYGCEQLRPLERMHILCNGKVIFCCQDWENTTIVGDLNLNSISEIWNSKLYDTIRESLYSKKIIAPEICRNCKLSLPFRG